MKKLGAGDLIHRWRSFRSGLDDLPIEDALTKTIEFWHRVPFVPFYLSPDRNPEWPDPWTLISENYYCDIAKALGILYTVAFTNHGKSLDLELRVYIDPSTGYQYNLVWIDQGKYIINLIDDGIVNIQQFDKELVLKYKYTRTDLALDSY